MYTCQIVVVSLGNGYTGLELVMGEFLYFSSEFVGLTFRFVEL